MPEEVIITKFIGDVSDLEAKVASVTSEMEGYDDAVAKAQKGTTDLTAKTGNLAKRTGELIGVEKQVRQATEQAANSQKAAAKSADTLANAQRRVSTATKDAASQGRGLSIFGRISQSISNGFKSAGNTVRQFAIGVRDGFREGIGSAGKLNTAVRSAGSGLEAAGAQTGILSRGMGLLASPIGLVAGAVAGLAINFARLDGVQDTIAKIRAGFGAFFDSLNSNQSVEDTIKAIGRAVELAEELDRLQLKRTTTSVEITKQRAEAEELARQARDITKSEAERVVLLKEANALLEDASKVTLDLNTKQAEIDYKKLVENIVNSNSQSLEPSFQRALRSQTQLTENAAKLIEVLSADLNIDVDEDLFSAAAQSANEAVQASTEVALEQERNLNRIKALEEKAADEAKRRNEKARADAEKANAERLKRAQDILAAEQKIADVLKGVRDAEFRTGLDERGAQVFDLEQAADDRIAILTAEFDKEKKLTGDTAAAIIKIEQDRSAAIAKARKGSGDDLSVAGTVDEINKQFDAEREAAEQNVDAIVAIEIRRAAAIKEVRQASSAEVTALEKKFYADDVKLAKDALAEIDKAVKSEGQNQADAINARYQKLLDNAAKFITDEDELNRTRVALNAARQQELDKIIDESEQRRLDTYKKVIDVLGQGITEALAIVATSFEAGKDQINENYDQQLSDLQQSNQQELAEIESRNDTQAELERARNQATASYMDERNRIEQERGRELQKNREDQEKAFLKTLLDTLEKAVQIYVAEVVVKQIADGAAQGGLPGALAGAVIGAAIGAIISGIFSALKSSIGGAYEGERDIGSGGERPIWSGKDGYVRRVHRGEDIIAADKTKKYRKELDLIHRGRLHEVLKTNISRTDRTERLHKVLDFDYAAPMRADFARMAEMQQVVPRIERYLSSDAGQRIVASATLPKNYDKNIVEAQNRLAGEQKRTNELLEELVTRKSRGRGDQYW